LLGEQKTVVVGYSLWRLPSGAYSCYVPAAPTRTAECSRSLPENYLYFVGISLTIPTGGTSVGVPQQHAVTVSTVTLSLPGDDDGSAADLRGWLKSTGPDAPWRLLPQPPSEGQGPAETVGLVLDSTAATVALYDRFRLWLSRRRSRTTRVRLTAEVELAGQAYTLTVTLDPRESEDGRTA
jgi:hypothetical protein